MTLPRAGITLAIAQHWSNSSSPSRSLISIERQRESMDGFVLRSKKKAHWSVVWDLLIAAHAISLGTRLVTNNLREFRRIPGLRVENWV